MRDLPDLGIAMTQMHKSLQRLLTLGPRIRSSLRRRDLRALVRRAGVKIARRLGRDLSDAYMDWVEDQAPSAAALAAQRRWSRTASGAPRFALLILGDGVGRAKLRRTMRSLRRQTYGHWTAAVLGPGGAAAAIGAGDDFMGFLRAGDTLSPEALYEFARAITGGQPGPEVLYCDEDHLGRGDRTRRGPVFKPSWSPEMLLGYHYTGRLMLARRSLVEEAGGFDGSLGGAAEWDLMLRLSERADRVARVPLCLYHNGGEIDRGDAAARRMALESHLRRIGLEGGRAAEQANTTFRVTWEPGHRPLVSVIIPTVDSPGLIRECVEGLLERTSYANKELILVDSGTTDGATLSLYERWTAGGAVSVVPLREPFNYSAACNQGARSARGEYLLFLNNDIEVIEAGWLEELVRWAERPGVGVVGTKLLYPDGTIEHAGMGLQDLGSLLFFRGPDDVRTPPCEALFGTPNHYRDTGALTGACQLVGRRLFEELGGYDERSLIACSDVILCAKAAKLGYRNVYTPYAALVHREASTRGRSNPGDDLLLLAQVLEGLGIRDDPYFHPQLDPHQPAPALPAHWVEGAGAHLRRRIAKLTAFGPGGEPARLVAGVSTRSALRALPELPACARVTGAEVGRDAGAAAWFMIDLLRREEGLWARFPRALGGGAGGEFCAWLCTEGAARHGLPREAGVAIRSAFAAQPGLAVSRLIDYLGLENPLFRVARMPHLLAGLGGWLLRHGAEHGVSEQQVWWFLLEAAEDPVGELVRVYLTNPGWQEHFPDAPGGSGWRRLTDWLRRRHGLDASACGHPSRSRWIAGLQAAGRSLGVRSTSLPGDAGDDGEAGRLLESGNLQSRFASGDGTHWLGRAGADGNPENGRRFGLNILAHFCASTGLQASAMSTIRSLELVAIESSCRDVPTFFASAEQERSRYLGLEVFDTTLIHVQPTPFFGSCYERAGLHPRRDVHRIAMWYWEYGQVPEEWRAIARDVDEIWAPTRFIGDALRKTIPLPIFDLMPGVEVGEVTPFDRARLGVPADHTLFLFVFDMLSLMERKNPLNLIEAYRRAFRRDDKVSLVIKVGHTHVYSQEAARLRSAARRAGVMLLEQTLPRAELNGLIQACDCYISLHRSEGYGLTMAEAMLFGRPVIGTAYSGNLEFMDRSNSILIDHELVPVGRGSGFVPEHYLWAQPSIDKAADAMRWVYEHPAEASDLGRRAQQSAEETLSMLAAGRRFARRLEEIHLEPSSRLH